MTLKRPTSAGWITLAIAGLCVAGLADVAFAEDAPAAAAAAAPVPNKGDVAWMLVSSALVLMMSVPGLALFYGGLVRTKNMASVLTQVFAIVAMVGVVWTLYGYSLAFTDGDRKSTRLNSSHSSISYAVFCLKKKKKHSKIDFLRSPHYQRPDQLDIPHHRQRRLVKHNHRQPSPFARPRRLPHLLLFHPLYTA